ncbi:hypothetical protein GOP47_0018113 [Adiantum capillus-veneris]|uniref:Profilin n=1 Tax=Adiantum capillus-veneris TaxID=13818 RepID=A0A9D4ZBI8_ADICA|nr:hypothetical protein GOP47_0018113 [Adiantum capillus-veneris]
MSWDAYVDDHLMCAFPTGNTLTSAAIIGLDGSVWAASSKFPEIKTDEVTAIVNAFNSDGGELAQRGLFIGGAKYLVVQGEQGVVIRGKKGAGGVTIKKTNLCMVFGIYDEPVTGGECNSVVEKLGDYLVDQGY